jgi:hypothetical protein
VNLYTANNRQKSLSTRNFSAINAKFPRRLVVANPQRRRRERYIFQKTSQERHLLLLIICAEKLYHNLRRILYVERLFACKPWLPISPQLSYWTSAVTRFILGFLVTWPRDLALGLHLSEDLPHHQTWTQTLQMLCGHYLILNIHTFKSTRGRSVV